MYCKGKTMNLKLSRMIYSQNGIFGGITGDSGFLYMSLEHAYVVTDNTVSPPSVSFVSKIPAGIYKCVRGIHHLHSKDSKGNPILIPIETFEITGIPDFNGVSVTGCLFHPANYNEELEGCVASGLAIENKLGGRGKMLTHSEAAFKQFMASQKDVSEFILTVE